MTYFLFRFNQQKEDRVRRRAARYGIEVIAPRVTTWRKGKRGTKPKPVAVPAFHSWLILGIDLDGPYLPLGLGVRALDRSIRPVFMTAPDDRLVMATIPDAEIEGVKANRLFKGSSARAFSDLVVPDPKYTKSELVRILGGAATGLEGRVISADPKAREAELDMDGWPVKLVVSYDLLERAA